MKRSIFSKTRNFQTMSMVIVGVLIAGLGTFTLQQQANTEREAQIAAAKRQQAAESEQEEKLRLQEAQRVEAEKEQTGGTEEQEQQTPATDSRPTDETKPGDVIAQDSETGVKTYWMGSLQADPATLTHSLSATENPKVVLTSPDEEAVSVPSLAWENGASLTPVLQSGVDSEDFKQSWTISFELPEDVEPGAYEIYVVATLEPETGDKNRYEYSGYITVKVVE